MNAIMTKLTGNARGLRYTFNDEITITVKPSAIADVDHFNAAGKLFKKYPNIETIEIDGLHFVRTDAK